MNPIYEQLRDETFADDVPEHAGDDPPTTMLPAVGYPPPATTRAPREFRHDDGSVYSRVDPTDLPNCDDVDSTAVADPGAPA